MAINPSTKYPGQIASDPTNYPYGKAQNITLPGDGTGTPWEEALVNDIFGLQQKLLNAAGITPSGNPDTIVTSQYYEALQKTIGLPPRSSLIGMEISNSGGDPTNDITIGSGQCMDYSNVYLMDTGAGGFYTKQIDAAWAAGDNAGGFPTGITLVTGWYHVFVLLNPTTGALDAGYDSSLSAANLLTTAAVIAAGLTKYRRVGSVYYSSGIYGFRQYEDRFIWKEPGADYLGDPTTGTNITVLTPLGIRAMAMLQLIISENDTSGTHEVTMYHGDNSGSTNGIPIECGDVTIDQKQDQEMNLFTNGSSQVYAKNTSPGATALNLEVFTHGYMDTRGRASWTPF